MEASLIGKALVFGSKECRFEPCVSNIKYNLNSYVANHFNILNSKKMPRITILFTKRAHSFIKSLYNARVIQNYIVLTRENTKYIVFSSYHYKNTTYFSHLKIVSTPSKVQTISLAALRTISNSLSNSIVLLETDRGVITHLESLHYKIGGRILGVIS